MNKLFNKKIAIAEKRILELIKAGNLKSLSVIEGMDISEFYKEKSLNRLESAKIILKASNDFYSDYSEVVSAAYYSMYYIVHAFLALKYRKKLRQGLRGVHSITEKVVLYYLVKTKRLAKYLYDEYISTLETTSVLTDIDAFQEKAFSYAKDYDSSRSARELFTYNVTKSIEEFHAKNAISTAEEFIDVIRQVMLKRP